MEGMNFLLVKVTKKVCIRVILTILFVSNERGAAQTCMLLQVAAWHEHILL